MTIQQFKKIQAEGLFQDYSWPDDLAEFSKVNMIYAWNGTGKTTLSRIMKEFGDGSSANNAGGEIKVEGEIMSPSKFNDLGYQIEVFNSDYISKSIKEVKTGEANPIYIIGEEQQKIQNKINDKERQLSNKKTEKSENQENHEKAKEDLEKFYSEKALKIKTSLRGKIKEKYYNYGKTAYKKDLEKVIKEKIKLGSKEDDLDSLLTQLINSSDNSKYPDKSKEVNDLLDKIDTPRKKSIDTFDHKLPDLAHIENEVKDILKERVIQQSIESLQNDRDLEIWIKKGLDIYHESQDSENCPWCLQDTPEERITELESYFSDSFNRLTARIETCLINIDLDQEKLSNAQEFCNTDLDLYSEITSAFESAKSEIHKEIEEAQKWLESIKKDIEKKKNNIITAFDVTKKVPKITFDSLQKINDAIKQHNKICESFSQEIEKAAEEYIYASILNEIMQIKEKKATVLAHYKLLSQNIEELKKLQQDIEELRKDAKDNEVPIQELNEEIIDFFGHSEIQFVAQEDGYILRRGSGKIDKLSDGETSIISLLYFLKSLKNENINLDKLIVVIDDPVSSMDSSNLFRTSAFIGKRIHKFHQTFIFTHNFVLFRQTSNIVKIKLAKMKKRDKINSYILNAKIFKNGVRRSTIALAPKALEKYYSEYHFLFESILNASKDATSSLEWHYNLPNMARRLLESFLFFKFPPDKERKLTRLLQDSKIKFDKEKKDNLIKFLHEYSHKNIIPDLSQEENKISEARNIMKDLIDLIKCLDEEHYNGMVNSLKS